MLYDKEECRAGHRRGKVCIYLLNQLFTILLFYPLINSFTHIFIQSFTHLFIHCLISVLQNHLLSVFDNTRLVTFDEKVYDKILAINSQEGEKVDLDETVMAQVHL